MKSVGSTDKVFEPESKGLVHEYASGIPRQINNIATACLINAASKDLKKVYNRARQESITKELLDIVGGANAVG